MDLISIETPSENDMIEEFIAKGKIKLEKKPQDTNTDVCVINAQEV